MDPGEPETWTRHPPDATGGGSNGLPPDFQFFNAERLMEFHDRRCAYVTAQWRRKHRGPQGAPEAPAAPSATMILTSWQS